MKSNSILTAAVVATFILSAMWMAAQMNDNATDPIAEVICSWHFEHDPIHTSAAGAGGGGGGSGFPISPVSPVFPRTESVTVVSRDAYHYDGCNCTLYRVEFDSATGIATAMKVDLPE